MLKKFLIACTILLSVVFLAALSISFIYEDQVKKIIIAQINKQLITPIEVRDIKFSLINNFPDASLSFYDVKAKSVYQGNERLKCPEILFTAGEISLHFNLKDIFYGNYIINKIGLKSGKLNLFTDSKRHDNYHCWKSDTLTSTEKVKFKLNRVSFNQFIISYTDLKGGLSSIIDLNNAKLKGEIYSTNFALLLNAKFKINQLHYENNQYLRNKNVVLNIGLIKENKVFSFTDAEATIEKLKLALSGSFGSTKINFAAKGKEVDIQSFLSFLPEGLYAKFNEYSSEGRFTFDLSVKGKPQDPKVKVDFSIIDSKLKKKDSNIEVNHLNLNGYYSNGSAHNMKTSGLYVSNFSAFINQSPIDGTFSVLDFTNPFIDGNVKANVDLNEIKEVLKLDTFSVLQGKANLNLRVACTLEQLKQQDLSKTKAGQLSGVFQLTEGKLQFTNDQLGYDNIEADLYADDNYLLVKKLILNHGKSQIDLHGELTNYRVIFAQNSEKAMLRAYLTSANFELEDWLPKNQNKANLGAEQNGVFLDNIELRLRANMSIFKLDKFVASNVAGEIYFRENKFRFDSISFNAMDGKVAANGMIEIQKNGAFDLICDAKLSKINIEKLFQQLNNFGQSTLTDKHIAGKLSSEIRYKSSWKKLEKINQESILADATVVITDGELNNFTPLNKLSGFVSVSELSHIKFKELSNHITISNGKIYIPQFQINSSALNLFCNGTHDFDNNIDYHFKVTLNELLSRKRKREVSQKNEFNEIEDDEQGKTTLFISMTGSIDNPQIKFDKKELKKFVKDEVSNEKKIVKQLLKDEFGLFKKDQSLKEKMEKKSKNKGQFEVEWEEDIKPQNTKEQLEKNKAATDKGSKFFEGEKKNDKSKVKPEKEENSDDYL